MEKPLHEMTDDEKKAYFEEINLRILRSSAKGRFDLQKDHKIAMFREAGKPMVDFYLQWGTWRIVGTGKIQDITRYFEDGHQKRGAKYFLRWYKNQEVKE